ncbi:MAG TPA: hypothetical protein PKC28_06960 [Bdellovibrionales bacterium]|nr:hypothetical protein [Bdellovibrionales bacterium]
MKTPNLRAQGGQMITEAILIMVMTLGFTMLVANFFKSEEMFRKLLTGPWASLSGMLQNGVWAPAGTGAAAHPNSHGRHIAIEGELAR